MLSAVVWFYEWAGSFFWLYAWGIVSVFSVFMAMFYSQLIVPLFNKQTPLEAEMCIRDRQKTGLCRSDIKEGRDHRETADDLHNGVQPGVFYSAFPVLGHDLFADDN